ncbi:hypothetical protein KF840_20940 [bacterium]|nr:hypothetical protein [bacterium]
MRSLLVVLSLLLLAPAAQGRCTGDCGGGGGAVTIDELVLGVNVALGVAPLAACPAFPACEVGPVCVADLIRAVRNALEGCPAPALPAIVASDPAPGAVDVPRTAWVRVEFAAPVDPADFSDLAWVQCGNRQLDRRAPVRTTALSPTVVVFDPIGGELPLPSGEECALILPGTRIDFRAAPRSESLPTIHYDRSDRRHLAPLPDDAFYVADDDGGHLAIPVPDGPDDVRRIFGGLLLGDGARLTGFSPLAYWVIELSDAVDPATVPLTPAASLDPLATMRLIDVTPGADTHGERIPFRVEPRDDTSVTGVVSHTLLLFPSIPLTAHHQYGLVLTRRVLADPSRPFAMSEAMASCLAEPPIESAECARLRAVADQVLAATAAHGPPIERADAALVLRATIGDTAHIADDQVAVKEQMAAVEPPAYTITSVVPGSSGDVAAIVSGTWQAPDWRDGLNFARDEAGRPRQTRTRAVPFTLALPTAALRGPVPIVMYQHGNPGSSEAEVPSAARRSLAAQGFAVIGFTDILNRELSAGVTDQQQAILAQVAPVLQSILERGRVPDFWAETRAEQIAFLRFIDGLGGLDVLPLGAPDGVPDLAPERPRMYLGISEGANNGPGILPYAPEIRAAALVAGGARLSEVLLHQADDLFLTVLGGIFPNMTPADIWMGVSLFQHLYDPQDAHNHAPFLARTPVALPGDPPQRASVLLVEGLDDTLVPNHATDSLAWSLGPLPHLAPVQRAVPFLEVVSGPLQGNLAADRSGAFYQYVPTGVAGIDPTPGCAVLSPAIGGEGHYCAQSAAESFLQRATFFTSALDGVPLIIDPLAQGALAPVGMSAEELVR